MRVFAVNAAWSAAFRIPLFWLLAAGAAVALAQVTPYSNWRLIASVTGQSQNSLPDLVTSQDFAFALASAIVQAGLALGFAFFVAHVLLIRAALQSAQWTLGRRSRERFAANFDRIAERLRRHAIIGHAWSAFEETLVRTDGVVRNTARPQSFINLAHARERLFGLKMMASIPGFFVGLGLLLTFIGLVLALYRAAGSTGAGSADAMTKSLTDLLHAATFKFATSIAGLGASLALSLLFRIYQIWIEGAFDRFGRALEARMRYQPPQRMAAESLELLEAQRDELKEINSEAFFARLGDSVAPRLQTAFAEAISPISSGLDRTVAELKQTSQSGVTDLVQNFVDRLDHGAGRELGQVVETLVSLKEGLEGIRASLAGSGQDVSDRLAAAAEHLSQSVARAGAALDNSATGVAGKVESAMEQLAGKLEAQTAAFGTEMAALQRAVAAQMEESGRVARQAGEDAAGASRRAVAEAAAATQQATRTAVGGMQAAVAEVTENLGARIAGLAEALQAVEGAFRVQTQHLDTVSARSRETADAFGRVAGDVRSATEPMLGQSERVAQAADRMATSVAGSVDQLSAAQQAASGIAHQLSTHMEQIGKVWDEIGRVWDRYESRFTQVDEELGRAADRFREEVSRHQDAMRTFVQDVDRHTESILSRISSAVSDLDGSIQELSDTLAPFVQRMKRGEAAE